MMAVKLGVPVVPVRVNGTDELMPNRRIIPRRGRVEVRFGEALRFSSEVSYMKAAEVIEKAVDALAKTVQ